MNLRKNRRQFIQSASSLFAMAVGTSCSLRFESFSLPGESESITADVERFFRAIAKGDDKDVRLMLESKADLLAARDAEGLSGYAVALLRGHQSVAKVIVEFGYHSDLHESALALDWDRFEKLAAAAGDQVDSSVNRIHPIGGSAMFAAARGGAGMDIWRVYGQCGDPNIVPMRGDYLSSLQAALRYSDLPTAELTAATLLSNATDPDSRGPGDVSPLHIAAERGSVELVEMLVRLGADVEARDDSARTARDVASQNKHKSVESLLKNPDQIHRTCHEFRTSADKDGKPCEVTDWSGIPITTRSEFVGLSHRNLQDVQSRSAKDPRLVHSVATTGEACVEAGAHMGQQAIVSHLVDLGAPYSLPTAVMMGDLASATKMLDEHPNRIHERGAHDFALLWYPVIGGSLPLMELLLARGAKVEQQHFLGTTALHWACMRGQLKMVELLIEHKADVNRAGRKFGAAAKTPLQLTNDPAVAELLRKKGAK